MRIEVTDDVGREVHRLCGMLNVTADALLRRLLKMPEHLDSALPRPQSPRPQEPNGLRTREGVTLEEGLQLRKRYKGKAYLARVEPDGIAVEGIANRFTSPSLAGVAITGYPVNGWLFWEYFDKEMREWRALDELRPKG